MMVSLRLGTEARSHTLSGEFPAFQTLFRAARLLQRAGESMMNRMMKGTVLLVAASCLMGGGFALAHRRAATAGAPECKLTVPSSSIDPMVFPTKNGAEALDAAILGNADDDAIRRVISEQGGVTVPHGTSCSPIEAGLTYSQVLVTSGALDGKTVWAPTIHTQGR
jgi:hypothetical protein